MKYDFSLKMVEDLINETDLSKSTKKNYWFEIKKFLDYHYDNYKLSNPKKITNDQINSYILEKINSYTNPSSKRCMKRSIILMYNLLNIKKDITPITIADVKTEVIPQVESQKYIISYCNKMREPVHRLMGLLLYSTGIQLKQLVLIKISDVNFKKNTIEIATETGKFHSIFPKSLKSDLKEHVKKRSSGEPLFKTRLGGAYHSRTVDWSFKTAYTENNMPRPICANTFKASCIVHLLKQGFNEYQIHNKLGLTQSPLIKRLSEIHSKKIKYDLI